MLVQHDVDCPSLDTLTGTANEPSLHYHSADVRVKATPEIALLPADGTAHLFITSASLMIYVPEGRLLVTVLYPEIVLHAVVSTPQALYLQIEADDLDDLVQDTSAQLEMVELSLSSPATGSDTADAMFAALSKCASMHPDPTSSEGEDGEGRLDDMLNDPNHSWITSESIHGQFEDAVELPAVEPEADSAETNGDGEVRKWRRTS